MNKSQISQNLSTALKGSPKPSTMDTNVLAVKTMNYTLESEIRSREH